MSISAQKKQDNVPIAIRQQMRQNLHQQDLQQQQNLQQQNLQQQQQAPISQKELGKQKMEEHIAANENLYADKKLDKHGNATLEIARMSKKDVHENAMTERRDAFHQQLALNCEMDQKLTYGRSCQQALSAIQHFTSMNLNQASHAMQGEAVAQARQAVAAGIEELRQLSQRQQAIQAQIRELSLQFGDTQDQALIPQIEALSRQMEELFAHEANLQQEKAILERYQLYFDTMTNGRLKVPEDGEIPPGWKVTQDPILNNDKLEWKDVRNQPLFAHESSLEDIQQGAVGDCYLEAALGNLIATNPEKLKECIVDNDDGTVTVRFYKTENVDDVPEMRAACNNKYWGGLNGMQLLTKIAHSLYDETGSSDGLRTLFQMKDAPGVGLNHDPKMGEKMAVRSSLANMLAPAMNHPEEMQSILREIAEEPAMQAFINNAQEYIYNNPNLEAGDFSVLENIMQKLSDNVSFNEMEAIAKKYESRTNQISQKPQNVHPVYITVTKEIPVIKGSDQTYYSHGSLVAMMIQKAYAASNLHIKNKKMSDFFANHLDEVLEPGYGKATETEKEAMLFRAKQKLRDKYFNSYKNIASGNSAEFLYELFNDENKRIVDENALWTDIKDKKTEIGKCAAKIYAEENYQFTNKNEQLPKAQVQEIYKKITNNVLLRLSEKIEARENKSTIWTRAFLAQHRAPVTVEDFEEKLRSIKKWGSGSDTYRQIMTDVKKLAPANAKPKEIQELFDQVMEKVIEATKKALEDPESNVIVHHKMFATKMEDGKEVPLYTPRALKRYAAIEKALKNKIPVGMGTRKYALKEGGSGLNGESMSRGLVEGHGYSIIGCKEIDGHKFVILRNPWGGTVRNYRVRLKPDPNGGPPIKEYDVDIFDTKDEQEGQFRMELNDFMLRTDNFYGLSE